MGEFGWKEVLKQFLGEPRGKTLSAAWDGDHYAVYEEKQSKRLLLLTRERLASQALAERFFGQYSEALEKKHENAAIFFASRISFPSTHRMAESSCAVLKTNASLWKEAIAPSFFNSTGNELAAGARAAQSTGKDCERNCETRPRLQIERVGPGE